MAFMAILGKGENSPFPSLVLIGWLDNQINRRQIDKRKSNLIACTWDPHIHERIRDFTYMRDSEIKRGNEVYKTS